MFVLVEPVEVFNLEHPPPSVIAFLNSKTVVQWAEVTIGL
jgi:hypothetical protein